MKTIYAFSGGSGVGKTYTRTHDEKLNKLPCLDISDVYDQFPDADPSFAWTIFANQIADKIEWGIDFVVEAYFMRGKLRRTWLEGYADQNGYRIVWYDLHEEFEVRKERILNQLERELNCADPLLSETIYLKHYARLWLLCKECGKEPDPAWHVRS